MRLTSSNENEPTTNVFEPMKSGVEVPAVVSNPDVKAAIENPRPPEDPKDRFWHIVYRTGFVIAISALVLAALVGVAGWATAAQSQQTSNCLNSLLGGPRVDASNQQTDAQNALNAAELTKSEAQGKAVGEIVAGNVKTGMDEYQAADAAYGVAADKYIAAAAHVAQIRAAHPLGHC